MNRELINTIRKTSTAPIPAVKAYKAENVASGNIKGVNRFSFNLRFGNRSAAESVDREALIRQANAVVEAHQWRMDTLVKKDLQARVADWRKKRFMEQFNKLTETGHIDDVDALMSGIEAFGSDDEIYKQFIDVLSTVMEKHYETGFIAEAENKIQCAGLIKGIMQLLFNWEGSIGNGGAVAHNIYDRLSSYFDLYHFDNNADFFNYIDDSPLAAGSIVSELTEGTGHVYTTIGYDANNKYKILEQAGLHEKYSDKTGNARFAERWQTKDMFGNAPFIKAQDIYEGIDKETKLPIYDHQYGLYPRITEGMPFRGGDRAREVAVPKGPAAKLFNDVYADAMKKITRRHNAAKGLGQMYTNLSKEAAKIMNPDLR